MATIVERARAEGRYEYGVDEHGLYELCTDEPITEWDSYTIGTRKTDRDPFRLDRRPGALLDGFASPFRELPPENRSFALCYPGPDGNAIWIDQDIEVRSNVQDMATFEALYAAALAEHPDHFAVQVHCHS